MRENSWGLLFVLLGYVGELLFFMFVIKRYIMVGDFELLQMLTARPDR